MAEGAEVVEEAEPSVIPFPKLDFSDSVFRLLQSADGLGQTQLGRAEKRLRAVSVPLHFGHVGGSGRGVGLGTELPPAHLDCIESNTATELRVSS
jgi:hypothetical protein